MAQIGTLSDAAERKYVGTWLKARADRRIAEAVDAGDRRRIHKAICDALGQTSISRLRDYADGTHFPTPRVLRALARALDVSSLGLLAASGYQRELLRLVYAITVAGRSPRYRPYAHTAIAAAIALFPRRGERYRTQRTAFDAFTGVLAAAQHPEGSMDDLADRMDDVAEHVDRRAVRLGGPLKRAFDALGDGSLDVACRLAVAGELVRVWALAADPRARSLEPLIYWPPPAVGVAATSAYQTALLEMLTALPRETL
jgi:hypothetical protein